MGDAVKLNDWFAELYSFAIERYGHGFIVADYSGSSGHEAVYYGRSFQGSVQPLVRDPFDTAEEAKKAVESHFRSLLP